MASSSPLRRLLLALTLVLMGAQGLRAQSYQSAFSEVKFDRAKGPSTFNAAVQVDAASGAVSMDLPCGPGIGERGLRFRPALSLRIAPQLGVSSVNEEHLWGVSQAGTLFFNTVTIDTLYQRGYGSAAFSPGTFDLALYGADEHQSGYSLPGGGGGSILGAVPPGMTPAAAQTLLTRFGLTDTVATLPALSQDGSAPFVQQGSSGHLVVGLTKAGSSDQGTDEVQDWLYSSTVNSGDLQYRWPRRLLVVQGEVACEFTYVSHLFHNEPRPYLTHDTRGATLKTAHYLLTRILNRFGEAITFTYDADGIGYTATWNTTGAQIRVAASSNRPAGPAQPVLSTIGRNLGPLVPVTVTYLSGSTASFSYTLQLGSPGTEASLPLNAGGQPGSAAPLALHGQRLTNHHWGEAALAVQPVQVTRDATGETIGFTYAAGPASTWGAGPVVPTILSAVTFPNRVVALDWAAYRYKPNFGAYSWSPIPGSGRRPAYAYGVRALLDTDTLSGAERATNYVRVVPQLNWAETVPQPGEDVSEYWVNRDFYTAILTQDGQAAVHRFVEPPDPGAGSTGEDGIRGLAYLKHLEREVRHYEAGVDWQADLAATSPGSSTAYRWEVLDHFSTQSVADAAGPGRPLPVPYPTRTRTYDRDSQTFQSQESLGWDGNQFGWTLNYRTTDLVASPDLGFVALPTGTPPSSPAAGTQDLVTRTLDTRLAEWLLGRVSQETTARTQDSTGNGTTAGAPPALSRTLHATLNTLTALNSTGADASVLTSFAYGDSGLAAALPASASLSSPQGFAWSGSAGASYGYSSGYLSAITTGPLTFTQTPDGFGRPIAQTDGNGLSTAIAWDAAGRLQSLTPPGGERATVFSYPDLTHLRVTRGAQVTEHVYNAFGERVLERRQDPTGAWSHKVFGRDLAGRPSGETIWLPGFGTEHETLWRQLNLTQATVETIPGTSVCKRWGALNPDTGERDCVQWQTSPPTTITHDPLYLGSSLTYDARGRVNLSREATGVTTTFAYPVSAGFLKAQTLGTIQTTQLLQDAAGRLKQVTDAKGRVTSYAYDASHRLVSVVQNDVAGRQQTRLWQYNSLGWLTAITQPESGVTGYGAFTILGKPQTTTYNGRLVTTLLDVLGRPGSVTSADGTVAQGFQYSLARLASSQDGAISASYGYDGGTGRLTSLQTTAAGQSFTQTFGYGDGYGQRTSGHTSHQGWAQSYHAAAGLPALLTYNGQTIADTSTWSASYDAVSWMPTAIQYGNAASSSFSYQLDQGRLAGITHRRAGGTVLENWSYLATDYDGAGNLLRERDLQTGLADTYSYDELNRLIGADLQSRDFGRVTQTFAYDGFGNRILGTIASPSGVTPSSTANLLLAASQPELVNSNRLPKFMTNNAATGAEYDAQGNLTQVFTPQGQVLSMGYDALGRVTSVSNLSTGVREAYQYRADGLRTVIDETLGGVFQKQRVQVYNDLRQLVAQYEKGTTGSLTWKRDLLYRGGAQVAEYDAAGLHVTQVDRLGSPRVVTGPSGAEEARQKFLPFGELLDYSGPQPHKGYTGHEQTDQTGLIYMQARFYLPWVGRFGSPDPARDQHFEFTQSWNINSYVMNNPVMATDPTGLATEVAGTAGDPEPVGAPTARTMGGGGTESLTNAGNKEQGKAQAKPPEKRTIIQKVVAWAKFLAPHGVGIGGGTSAGAGVGVPSATVHASSAAMVYYNDNGAGKKIQTGGIATAGTGATVGLFAGVGGEVTLTNARSNNDESGKAAFASVNGGWGPAKLSISFSVSANGIWNLTVGPPMAGASAGASFDFGVQTTKATSSDAPATKLPTD